MSDNQASLVSIPSRRKTAWIDSKMGDLMVNPNSRYCHGSQGSHGRINLRRSWPWRLLALLSLSVSLAGAAGSAAAAPEQPVRIAGAIYLGDLPTLVAETKGLFAKRGLDADVSFGKSGKHNLQRLLAGEVDFALMALTPLVLDRIADHHPGGPEGPVILAGLVHSTLINRVVFRSDGSISEPADLHDRGVALPSGTNAEFLWWLFATAHGLDPSRISLQDHAIDAIPALIISGAVDAAVIWEPWVSGLSLQLGDALGQFPVHDLYAAKWVLVTLRQTATVRPELCKAVLAVYRDAIRQINRDYSDALAIYAERAALPADRLRDAWTAQVLDYQLSLDWSLIGALQMQLRWAQQHSTSAAEGVGQQPIEVASFFDDAALRSLMPELVSIPPPLPSAP